MLKGEELGRAIDEAIKLKGVTKVKVAEHFGIKPPSVNSWIKTGRIGKEHIEKLVDYFSDVVSPEHFGLERLYNKITESNVEPTNDIQAPIPIICWVAAGCFAGITEEILPSVQDRDAWAHTTRKHSANAFGLRVRGQSMCDPTGRVSFQEGETILVDPEMEPRNGDYVIVRLDDANEATFKKLVIEGEKKYLIALNPDWPDRIIEVNENATIVGVVFEKTWRLR
ncbi:LexA family protein [Vitreoscilla sp. C1]|uniref:LexA family protein n=1 Tax=Vitreoscilla sp. (strain C1) TaxID=96942 RepID=UPI000CDBB1DC|nr:S24 family peptidase [Vitreoscilla sp. C1]